MPLLSYRSLSLSFSRWRETNDSHTSTHQKRQFVRHAQRKKCDNRTEGRGRATQCITSAHASHPPFSTDLLDPFSSYSCPLLLLNDKAHEETARRRNPLQTFSLHSLLLHHPPPPPHPPLRPPLHLIPPSPHHTPLRLKRDHFLQLQLQQQRCGTRPSAASRESVREKTRTFPRSHSPALLLAHCIGLCSVSVSERVHSYAYTRCLQF